jgi:hypothetical protein
MTAPAAWILAVLGVGFVAQVDTQSLPRMVATERAFAAATAEIGVRDGFLTFFSDDAVSLDAGRTGATTSVSGAKDGLAKQALSKLPILSRLIWEPSTGQISEDGTLGWLTGPYAVLVLTTRDVTSQGAYFSVWKRQADGTFRVWLDEGITLPGIWRDAAEFRAAPAADPGQAGTANETLDEAERAVSSGGSAWAARLAGSIRVHRDGVMPITGRDAAATWAQSAWTTVAFTVVRTERAGSGDLGVALGGYDATTSGGAEHGTWTRVWQRDVTSHWRIVFETSKATK